MTAYEMRISDWSSDVCSSDLGRPDILLLDETLAGLGRSEVMDVERVIRGLATDSVTIVIIEHTMHAMVRLVDRFLLLDHGAVLGGGTPADVPRDPRVGEAFLGKNWASHAAGWAPTGRLLAR